MPYLVEGCRRSCQKSTSSSSHQFHLSSSCISMFGIMSTSPNTTNGDIPLHCRGCLFVSKRKTKKYKGHWNLKKQRIICQGLTSHIQVNTNCEDYYVDSNLLHRNTIDKFDGYDYSTSTVEMCQPAKPAPPTHSASQMGLLNSSPQPSSSSIDQIRSLNRQVLYNSLRPNLNRELIKNTLTSQQNNKKRKSNNVQQVDSPDVDAHEKEVLALHQDDETESFGNNDLDSLNDDDNFIQPMTMMEFRDPDDPNIPNFPTPVYHALSFQLVAEVELMNIIVAHKMPMYVFKPIMEWASRNANKTVGKKGKKKNAFLMEEPRNRETIMKQLVTTISCVEYKFHPHMINWLPDNKPVQVYVRPFLQAVKSLLTNTDLVKEGNFSLPNPDTPFVGPDFKMKDDTIISELHHGEWWINTWHEQCQKGNEILVPVILYMDGISIDVHGKLSITPLNMTLGIFNNETRRRSEAWETLYFHPDKEYHSFSKNHKNSGVHNLTNLHTGLQVALEEFKDEICNLNKPLIWNNLPYAGKIWENVELKFAIAYVIGDTQLHDQLCCKYGSRSPGVSMLCRHCKCPTEDTCNPANDSYNSNLFQPDDFIANDIDSQHNLNYFQGISHHPVQNAFHDLNMGSNIHNIHLASPGETLHMHQLGIAKRTIQSFKLLIPKKNCNKFDQVACRYGGLLHRQSDRNFPRTKFNSVLSTTMKEGKDFAGMLVCILVATLSNSGNYFPKKIDPVAISNQIYFIELVIGMEEYLKHGGIARSDLNILEKMMIHFLNEINKNCKRQKGMLNRLIKNHLYLHIPRYVKMWGPPSGWDSGPSESHHKSEIKGPSKNTQLNGRTLIHQLCTRKSEKYLLNRVTNLYKDVTKPCNLDEKTNISLSLTGSSCTITKIGEDVQTEWKTTPNKDKILFPKEVLEFCHIYVLPLTGKNSLDLYTKHHRIDKTSQKKHIFRANPSFQNNSGQDSNIWYDWAAFDMDEQSIPCQILCFVDLQSLVSTTTNIGGYVISSPGTYAVVRRFLHDP